MGAHSTKTDFDWAYVVEEPHKTRRDIILKKYPEIKRLFGHDPSLKWKLTLLVIIQIASLWFLQDKSFVFLIFTGYFFNGVINHSLSLSIHEIAHNTVFGNSRPLSNRLFGMFANLPLVLPFSATFKIYHVEHHRYLAHEFYDVDVPTKWEGEFFCTTFKKIIFVILQPIIFAFRPLVVYPKKPERLEVLNTLVQLIFNFIVVKFFGIRMLIYLVGGTWLAMGLHPLGGHFISEHYMFGENGYTFSYYGPLNAITWNVGYHNEHHDFPAIPGSRLPLVRKIAPEFYDDLPQHTSWTKVLYDFITKPEFSPYSRMKRRARKE